MHSSLLRLVALLLLTLVVLVSLGAFLYVCVDSLTDDEIADAVIAFYVFVLGGVFCFQPLDVIPVSSLLCMAGIIFAVVVNVQTVPRTVHEVTGWLQREIKSGADRSSVMAFLARHQVALHAMRSSTSGTESIMVLDYYTVPLLSCSYPEITLEFDKTNHLVDYGIQEQLSCP
jgi:hypothetical protein